MEMNETVKTNGKEGKSEKNKLKGKEEMKEANFLSHKT